MKKRILALLLVLILVATFVACGNNAPAPTPAPNTPAPTDTTPEPEPEPTLDFPTRPVEAVVPWAAGGGGDLVFRALAEVFQYHAGQPMVVRNVEGAGGAVGTAEFMSAAADGYSILHFNTASITRMHMTEVPFDVDTFVPVIQIVENPNYIVVQYDAPWQTIEEFIEDAMANPGAITVGNAGVGGGNHLAILLFEERTGTSFNHISYAGGGPAITGLLAGEVDAVIANAPEGMNNIEAGQLRMLVTLGAERFEGFPDVPTAIESGIDLIYEQWRGVVVPVGTPPEIIERLHDIIRNVVEDPRFIEAMRGMDANARYRGTEEFRQFIAEENALFHSAIRDNQIGDIYG